MQRTLHHLIVGIAVLRAARTLGEKDERKLRPPFILPEEFGATNRYHRTAREAARRNFRRVMIATPLLGATCAALLVFLTGYSWTNADWSVSRVETRLALSPEESLSAAIGLATLVAALSIALVVEAPGSITSPQRFATTSFWAEMASGAGVLTALVSVVIAALALADTPNRAEWTTVAVLWAVTALTVLLAAAVTGWHGREEVERWTRERKLRAQYDYLNTNFVALHWTGHWRRSYIKYVLELCVGVIVATYGSGWLAARLWGDGVYSPPWARIPIVLGVCAAILTLKVEAAYQQWRLAVGATWTDRLAGSYSAIFNLGITLFFAIGLIAAPDLTATIMIFVLWVGLVPLHGFLLHRSRKGFNGPLKFVLHRVTQAVHEDAIQLRRELARDTEQWNRVDGQADR